MAPDEGLRAPPRHGALQVEDVGVHKVRVDISWPAAGALLESVGLPAAYAARKPVALSGGERQRVAITHDLSIVRQITAQKACTTRACEAA
jgi:ABC-type dipeptide/oligopeptide/nickel transport system ATPase subunit